MKKVFLILALTVLFSSFASAQSTAFSFQGRLNDGTNPANGRYDLEFRLFNTITGGAQIGAVLSRPNTILINGVFSTILDFGAAAFNNPNNVFIEIAVRPNGSTNAFTILGPRQQITAVPFAIRATSAANADNSTNALNAQSAVNSINATNATNATTAANALSLGGVPAAGYAKLNAINPGQLIVDGNVRQSVYSYGLAKAMLEVSSFGEILRCYNSATNSTTGGCGFTVTTPFGSALGVFRINFGFPISNNFVSVTPHYTATNNSTNNSGANYRLFDSTSMEVFTFGAGDSADTDGRGFTIILF
ncbi:MAG TPA: hypothetical protein VGC97_19710 [Pyrinomonadaceae bacterium]|jgi:hypothetical protein